MVYWREHEATMNAPFLHIVARHLIYYKSKTSPGTHMSFPRGQKARVRCYRCLPEKGPSHRSKLWAGNWHSSILPGFEVNWINLCVQWVTLVLLKKGNDSDREAFLALSGTLQDPPFHLCLKVKALEDLWLQSMHPKQATANSLGSDQNKLIGWSSHNFGQKSGIA